MNPIVLRISTDIDITRMISKALTAMLNKYPSSPPDIQKNDVRARCDLLPGDLAGRIIALEFECESDKLSSVLVHELVMLYTVDLV